MSVIMHICENLNSNISDIQKQNTLLIGGNDIHGVFYKALDRVTTEKT